AWCGEYPAEARRSRSEAGTCNFLCGPCDFCGKLVWCGTGSASVFSWEWLSPGEGRTGGASATRYSLAAEIAE
ncbi:MAG: hypothetical protein AB7O38_30700, partial [Pirellulaceae bacterium]